MIRRMAPKQLRQPTSTSVVETLIAELHVLYPTKEPITPRSHLYDDLGMDSLDAVELSMALEDRLGIELDADYLRDIETVGSLVKKIEGMK